MSFKYLDLFLGRFYLGHFLFKVYVISQVAKPIRKFKKFGFPR